MIPKITVTEEGMTLLPVTNCFPEAPKRVKTNERIRKNVHLLIIFITSPFLFESWLKPTAKLQ